MRALLLILMALLTGCTTSYRRDPTDTLRPIGPPIGREFERGLENQSLEFIGSRAPDGFAFSESLLTGPDGKARANLLPVAMQCLLHGRAVAVTVWSHNENREVARLEVDAAQASEIINEWHVQTRLGAELRLRRTELALLDALMQQPDHAPLFDRLADIRQAVTLRPDWE